MKINIAELMDGQKNQLSIEMKDEIEKLDSFGDEIVLVGPTVFKGNVYISNGDFYIKGIAQSTGVFHCHRCLKKFEQTFYGEVDEKLVTEGSFEAETGEYYIIKNKQVELSEIIENTLVEALPMKIVCDENCKGLCLVCGKNLNEDTCDCSKDDIDPRLAKLKDLLQ
ncbi:YceD family protein [Inediibacterium massiliense]|uniref:YceD family protein n=1 Tax=Inediibacterium massiliense TaxID=1658111 RepID=UPI0006B421B6|nr:DUF177 domain-containing protein [Inediibacterium massiliense]